MRHGPRQTLAIARREAGASLAAPLTWVVLVLFLVVQGFSFFAVLRALADPRRPAPYGAVLRSHFGGHLLYWAFLFFVVAVSTMRLIAEEKRLGTWEALRTAAVSHVAIVIGKWLGALAFYAVLWAPTVAYVFMLRALAPPDATLDVGPIATAYLGVFTSGAAFLAVGLCASALTRSQLVAAIVTFAPLVLLLLIGLAPQIAPETMARHATFASLVAAVDVRRHLDDFARGIVDLRHVVFYAGLTMTALTTATVVIAYERRRELGSAVLGVALVATAALLGNVLVARHAVRLDATTSKVYSLEDRTRRILADLDVPVEILVVTAGQPAFAELYDVVGELVRRLAAASPRIAIATLDPALDPGRVAALAADYALTPDEVAGGGAVVFRAGGRRRVVALLDMAEFAPGEVGGKLTAFRGEDAFAAAILEVTDPVAPELCFTTAHGELPLEREPAGADVSRLVATLAADGMRVRPLGTLGAVPSSCAAVVLFGPRRPIAAAEAAVLEEWLGRGGRLLVALDGDRAAGAFVPTGLEELLERVGLRLGPGIVVDPSAEIGAPLTWATLNGYSTHPITAAWRGRRLSIWREPRWIEPLARVGSVTTPLVSSSPSGWAETELLGLVRAPSAPDARDAPGPVAVAAVAERVDSGARVVLLGSARSFASSVVESDGGANDALVASAVAWMTGRTKLVGIGAKSPEQLRVVLDASQEARLFVLCVLGLPGFAALLGLAAAWRRRRG